MVVVAVALICLEIPSYIVPVRYLQEMIDLLYVLVFSFLFSMIVDVLSFLTVHWIFESNESSHEDRVDSRVV